MRRRHVAALPAALTLLAAAAGSAGAQSQPPAQAFTLGPGGRATIGFDAFCLDFGRPFPQQIQGPGGLANDRVRGALAYVQSRALSADGQQALEAQYAVWQANNQQGSPAGTGTTQAVLGAAGTPPQTPQGTSLLDAARAGQMRLTVDSWRAEGSPVAIGGGRTDNFYGRGQLTAENVSGQSLSLHFPVGAVFPPANPADQNMAGYATTIQVQNTAQYLAATGAGAGVGGSLAPGAVGLVLAGLGYLVRRHGHGHTGGGISAPPLDRALRRSTSGHAGDGQGEGGPESTQVPRFARMPVRRG